MVLEAVGGLEVFPHGGLGVVVRSQERLANISAYTSSIAVSKTTQYQQVPVARRRSTLRDAVVRVVAIQTHEHTPLASRLGLDLLNDLGRDAGAFNHRDAN